MTTTSSTVPTWMRVAVRADFVAAVALTVAAPLLLLAAAIRTRKPARGRRVAALLARVQPPEVTVYLLIGERRAAFPAGVAARLLIAHNLLSGSGDLEQSWADRWRRVAGWYCLAGALLTAPNAVRHRRRRAAAALPGLHRADSRVRRAAPPPLYRTSSWGPLATSGSRSSWPARLFKPPSHVGAHQVLSRQGRRVIDGSHGWQCILSAGRRCVTPSRVWRSEADGSLRSTRTTLPEAPPIASRAARGRIGNADKRRTHQS